MAGHSKWANIKHRKAIVDARRGKVFTKLSKEIIVAARLGGGDPESNARLRMAIQNARAVSVPNDNIKRAIQRGTGEVEGALYEDVVYEGYGPGGVAIIVEATTDNRNRTVADVRAAFTKAEGSLGESNSVAWCFQRSGEVAIQTSLTGDELLLFAADVGADDVVEHDEGQTLSCSVETLGTVCRALVERSIHVVRTGFVWSPLQRVVVSDLLHVKRLVKLLDTLEDLDDVQYVYNNADVGDDVMDLMHP
jgi:YebC/PmpR family DNA-binding regulatory protein